MGGSGPTQFNNAAYFEPLNYLVPFFEMYFINAIIISISLVQIEKNWITPSNYQTKIIDY